MDLCPGDMSSDGSLPEALRGQLEPGERVVWHGRPSAALPAVERLKWLLVCALALAMIAPAAIALRAIVQAGWTLDRPMVLVALVTLGTVWIFWWLHAGLYYYNPWAIAHVHYGVTDRRLLMVYDWPWRRVVAMRLDGLAYATIVKEGPGGSGTIEFGEKGWVLPKLSLRGAEDTEFYFVENVRDVQAMIAKTRPT